MLIGIISDTHDHLDNFKKAIRFLGEKEVDFVIHCGDIVSPFTANLLNDLNCEYMGIFGNNDGDWLMINKFTRNRFTKGPVKIKMDGKDFVIFHEPFIIDNISLDIDFVVYGHTHYKKLERRDRQLVINPGTASGYISGESTMSILDTKSSEVGFVNIDVIE